MKKKVCVIDDDYIYQFTVKKTIETHDLAENIMVFYDGEEALKFFTENVEKVDELPEVVFLDINMPIMDGFQFMEEYIKLKPRIGKKIIIYMISSSVEPCDIERAKSISEIFDYIIKPVKPKELIALIEAYTED